MQNNQASIHSLLVPKIISNTQENKNKEN
uniref:Uncharacterized protein n=1 Tax=Arundo donax TaxID=35708 RepID=A0A0A9ERE1_ARUDO